MVNRDAKWVDTAKELHEIQLKIKFLEDQKKMVQKDLIKLSEEKPSTGNGFKFDIISRPGSIIYKNIPELQNIDLEPYRGPEVSYWKLTYTPQFDI